jgi:hypothetical protein
MSGERGSLTTLWHLVKVCFSLGRRALPKAIPLNRPYMTGQDLRHVAQMSDKGAGRVTVPAPCNGTLVWLV